MPQTSGTIAVSGLTAPVRVVRDRAGIPHISASNQVDLFFAQGFVQAQDRLFQMDLWLRASQGRLSEVLGANFIDRDAMTRRMQYRGDMKAEWATYGEDARAIAEAFVRGINTWVSIVREHPPQEFVQVNWPPAYWRAEDLLNRTDAFLESQDALDEIRRRHLPDAVADAVRLVGTAPFLSGSSPQLELIRTRSASRADVSRDHLVISETTGPLAAPAARYLVHLVAPGWNVIGATAPWLPGVAIGHNDRVAWAMTPLAVSTEEILIEPESAVIAREPQLLHIKGRGDMLPFTRDATADGVVIASDHEHQRVFVLRWKGFEPGTAAGLGALGLDRAHDWPSFRDAAAHWLMPARRIVYADVDDRAEHLDAQPGGTRRLEEARSVDAHVSDRALFPHFIHRFDIGPLTRPPDDAPLQLDVNVSEWDRSQAISAPGQSGAPSSARYADEAAKWSGGQRVELWFSGAAVTANADATLTLTPAPRR